MDHQEGTDQQGGCLEEGLQAELSLHLSEEGRAPQVGDSEEKAMQS